MNISADAIADCVLSTFAELPSKRKPRPRNDGSREWVPLAGIVLSQGSEDGKLSCASLGTGMKCLPANKLPQANGNVLHDWHAEVLAIRAFNRFLLDQCLLISSPPYPTSTWIRQRPTTEQAQHEHQPFAIREDVSIHMYCSEAPCGDASMELVMQNQEDATPWTTAPPTVDAASSTTSPSSPASTTTTEPPPSILRGRANFSHLGITRCKPSRPDAPPTLSKSCTDKLALKQAISLLSSTSSLLINPKNAYINTLVLPASQYVPAACTRAFTRSGRLKHLSDEVVEGWRGGYGWRPFTIHITSREFGWSRRAVAPGEKGVPSNLSAVWTPGWQETLIGGLLQGRKQFDARGASKICRRSMWRVGVQVAGLVGVKGLGEVLGERMTYGDLKGDVEVLEGRKKVKQDVTNVLGGWIRNTGDDDFTLSEHASS